MSEPMAAVASQRRRGTTAELAVALRTGPFEHALRLAIRSRGLTLDRLRVRLTPQATRAFIDRAKRVVASGRPPCPLCGQPLDARGHLCPRHNGYRR